MLEGWKQEGEALYKWFGDHYKWAPNEQAAAEMEREHNLRVQAAEDADRATAADLRTQADVVDPDAETPAAAPAPEPASDPNQTAPLDPAPEAPAEAPAAEAPGETGAAPAADASEASTTTTTEGA